MQKRKEKRREKIEKVDAEIDKSQCKEGGGCCRDKRVIKKHNSGVIVRMRGGGERERDGFESEYE